VTLYQLVKKVEDRTKSSPSKTKTSSNSTPHKMPGKTPPKLTPKKSPYRLPPVVARFVGHIHVIKNYRYLTWELLFIKMLICFLMKDSRCRLLFCKRKSFGVSRLYKDIWVCFHDLQCNLINSV